MPNLKHYAKQERGRLEAARASFIGLVIVGSGAWYIDHFISYIIAGFILVIWLIPTFFSRLFDPHTTRTWSAAAEVEVEGDPAKA